MDIARGFSIEQPVAFVPWGITETQLKALLGANLRHVTRGYYTAHCKSLGGMEHELGFHFKPRANGRLLELEFFRQAYPCQEESFKEFQDHFEHVFGAPSKTFPGTCGLPSHEWQLKGVTIVHFVHDRFGPEEHMRIKWSV